MSNKFSNFPKLKSNKIISDNGGTEIVPIVGNSLTTLDGLLSYNNTSGVLTYYWLSGNQWKIILTQSVETDIWEIVSDEIRNKYNRNLSINSIIKTNSLQEFTNGSKITMLSPLKISEVSEVTLNAGIKFNNKLLINTIEELSPDNGVSFNSTINTDSISSKTLGSNIVFKSRSVLPGIYTDTIYEKTGSAGTTLKNGLKTDNISVDVGTYVTFNNTIGVDTIRGKTSENTGSVFGMSVTSSALSMDSITNLRSTVNNNLSVGIIGKPTVTNNLDGTFTIGTINVQIRATNSDTATLLFLTCPSAILTPTIPSYFYVYAEYDTGSVTYNVETSILADFNTKILVAAIYAESNTSAIVNSYNCINALNFPQRSILSSGLELNIFNHLSGAMLGYTGITLTASAGYFYQGVNDIETTQKLTTDTFKYIYHVTTESNGVTSYVEGSDITDADCAYYDDGTQLVAMTAGYYSAQYVYVTVDNKYYVLYGKSESSSQAGALSISNQSPIPDKLRYMGIMIGKIIVQNSGGGVIVASYSSFDSQVAYQGVTSHSALSNLNSDDHLQYILSNQDQRNEVTDYLSENYIYAWSAGANKNLNLYSKGTGTIILNSGSSAKILGDTTSGYGLIIEDSVTSADTTYFKFNGTTNTGSIGISSDLIKWTATGSVILNSTDTSILNNGLYVDTITNYTTLTPLLFASDVQNSIANPYGIAWKMYNSSLGTGKTNSLRIGKNDTDSIGFEYTYSPSTMNGVNSIGYLKMYATGSSPISLLTFTETSVTSSLSLSASNGIETDSISAVGTDITFNDNLIIASGKAITTASSVDMTLSSGANIIGQAGNIYFRNSAMTTGTLMNLELGKSSTETFRAGFEYNTGGNYNIFKMGINNTGSYTEVLNMSSTLVTMTANINVPKIYVDEIYERQSSQSVAFVNGLKTNNIALRSGTYISVDSDMHTTDITIAGSDYLYANNIASHGVGNIDLNFAAQGEGTYIFTSTASTGNVAYFKNATDALIKIGKDTEYDLIGISSGVGCLGFYNGTTTGYPFAWDIDTVYLNIIENKTTNGNITLSSVGTGKIVLNTATTDETYDLFNSGLLTTEKIDVYIGKSNTTCGYINYYYNTTAASRYVSIGYVGQTSIIKAYGDGTKTGDFTTIYTDTITNHTVDTPVTISTDTIINGTLYTNSISSKTPGDTNLTFATSGAGIFNFVSDGVSTGPSVTLYNSASVNDLIYIGVDGNDNMYVGYTSTGKGILGINVSGAATGIIDYTNLQINANVALYTKDVNVDSTKKITTNKIATAIGGTTVTVEDNLITKGITAVGPITGGGWITASFATSTGNPVVLGTEPAGNAMIGAYNGSSWTALNIQRHNGSAGGDVNIGITTSNVNCYATFKTNTIGLLTTSGDLTIDSGTITSTSGHILIGGTVQTGFEDVRIFADSIFVETLVTGAMTYGSSSKKTKNIKKKYKDEDYNEIIEKFDNLDMYDYTYKDEYQNINHNCGDKKFFGCMAEDVEDKFDNITVNHTKNIKGLGVGRFEPYLLGAIKYLIKENKKIKKMLDLK